MSQPQHHFFVCTNQRPPGHPKGSCGQIGGSEVYMKLSEQIDTKNLWGKMKVSQSGCLGPCMAGAIMVCYPEGVWYQGVKPEDVEEIVESHVVGGKPVERLLLDPEMIG